MNASMHPTVDRIADAQAGLLSAGEAREVAAHLADCAECRDIEVRLTEVTDLLGEGGRDVAPIPADVASSLQAALHRAGVERAAGVTSLTERRTMEGSGQAAAPHRRGRLLLGAAAAVIVLAVGGSVMSNGLPGSDPAADDSAAGGASEGSGSGGSATGDGQMSAPEGDSPEKKTAKDAPSLDQGSVADYAQGLAADTVPVAVPPTRCVAKTAMSGHTDAARTTDALVSFEGRDAVLMVDAQRRQLTVLACPGPTRVLYRSGY